MQIKLGMSKVVLSRRNEEENSPLRFVRSRQIRELAGAKSTVKERDNETHRSLARLPGSSSPRFLSGLDGAQSDLIRALQGSAGPHWAGGARWNLTELLGSSSGLVETH